MSLKFVSYQHLVVTTVALKVYRNQLSVLVEVEFSFKGLHLAVGGRMNIFRLYYD